MAAPDRSNDNEALLTAMFGTREQREKKELLMQGLKDKYIVWHNERCAGRHGTVRNVPNASNALVNEMLTYYFGSKCWWLKKNPDGKTFDGEFVHMAKVYPPPTRPWEWCGTTLLFQDWRDREEANRRAVAQFRPGNRVTFTARGRQHTGIVARVGKRVSVAVENEGTWYVPGKDLKRV